MSLEEMKNKALVNAGMEVENLFLNGETQESIKDHKDVNKHFLIVAHIEAVQEYFKCDGCKRAEGSNDGHIYTCNCNVI